VYLRHLPSEAQKELHVVWIKATIATAAAVAVTAVVVNGMTTTSVQLSLQLQIVTQFSSGKQVVNGIPPANLNQNNNVHTDK